MNVNECKHYLANYLPGMICHTGFSVWGEIAPNSCHERVIAILEVIFTMLNICVLLVLVVPNGFYMLRPNSGNTNGSLRDCCIFPEIAWR
jgi:hypothetical protein